MYVPYISALQTAAILSTILSRYSLSTVGLEAYRLYCSGQLSTFNIEQRYRYKIIIIILIIITVWKWPRVVRILAFRGGLQVRLWLAKISAKFRKCDSYKLCLLCEKFSSQS